MEMNLIEQLMRRTPEGEANQRARQQWPFPEPTPAHKREKEPEPPSRFTIFDSPAWNSIKRKP